MMARTRRDWRDWCSRRNGRDGRNGCHEVSISAEEAIGHGAVAGAQRVNQVITVIKQSTNQVITESCGGGSERKSAHHGDQVIG